MAAPIPPPFFSPYLDDQSSKITSKPVPWEVRHGGPKNGADAKGYQRAKLLSSDELSLLKALDKTVRAMPATDANGNSRSHNGQASSWRKENNMLNSMSSSCANSRGSIQYKPFLWPSQTCLQVRYHEFQSLM